MANPLTGDYQAVIQISVRQINGLLGTLHQRRINPVASPSFAHSGAIRFGVEPLIYASDKIRVSKWFASPAVKTLSLQTELPEAAARVQPPGVVTFYESVVGDWTSAMLEPVHAGTARGIAEVQLSTPTISLSPGTTSEIIVEVRVRARLYTDPGSAAMPEWVHGDLRASYTVNTVIVNGQRKLRVHPPAHDNQVQFVPFPGAGVSPAQTPKVTTEIRRALQKNFAPLDLDLPPDFLFDQFRALAGPGVSVAFALPIQINAAPPGPGGIGTVNQHFINYDETGLAISREFVETMTNPLIESIRVSIDRIPEQESFWGDYTFSAHDFYLTWKAGGMDFIGTIEAKTSGVFAPDKTFHFSQTITVALDVAQQTLSVVPVGPPDVNSDLRTMFINVRDGALKNASAAINAQFQSARARLVAGLKRFDDYATLHYTSVEVTPDGIILRGKVNTSSRIPPVVHFQETAGGGAFTALQSWVPGGRIDSFEWTWVENESVIPWANPIQSHTDLHRFVFPKPPGFASAHRMCLRIEGTLISPDGFIEMTTAGDICRPSGYEKILIVPPWYLEVYMPIWWPDPPFDAVMDDWIVAHANLAGQPGDPHAPGVNTLIHFTGDRFERTLDELGEAVGRVQSQRERERPLTIMLVLPEGTFARTRREVMEARLGRGERLRAGSVHITEDVRGGWTQAFMSANASGPATFFMNPRRELVWRQEGPLDAARLPAVLDEFMMPAPAPSSAPLRLAIEAGEEALEAVFEDERGERTSLRRLRGRPVLLVFWKSWSTPCLRELQQLRDEHDEETAILAINGGEEADVLAQVREQHGLRFALIQDPGQEIATLYGVSCWPTTVSINREGVVDRVQLGRSHTHRAPFRELGHEREGN